MKVNLLAFAFIYFPESGLINGLPREKPKILGSLPFAAERPPRGTFDPAISY
jgi:hypothetical protein